MKLIFVLILSTFFTSAAWAATCRSGDGSANCVSATGNTSGCRMVGPRACWVKSDQGVCRKIINSTGQTIFVPARTTAELDSVPGSGAIFREAPGTTWCN